MAMLLLIYSHYAFLSRFIMPVGKRRFLPNTGIVFTGILAKIIQWVWK
ncbi:hypothetical protein [Escherichia albertii]|nr:hypothetical protein [Escherichia albertii]